MSRFAADLADAASSAGSPRAAAHAALIRGETELLTGQVEQAEATLRQAADLHRDTRTNSGESLSLERLAEVSTALGQRWKARRLLQGALRLAEGDPLGSHLLVKIHGAMVEAAADPADAANAAADGERALADSDVCQQCSMSFRMAAARAFADVGDLPSARRHLDEAARISEMWQGGPWPASVRDVRAHVEAAEARRAEAPPSP
jgi:tetratricopeptide (TPR) repeat protein